MRDYMKKFSTQGWVQPRVWKNAMKSRSSVLSLFATVVVGVSCSSVLAEV